MKKTDVYVVVDTPKRAKKLKNVLDMFGEDIYSEPDNNNPDHNGMGSDWRYGFSNGSWQGFNTKWAGHNGKIFKELSIKELRNILAKEHLKAGDIIVAGIGSTKYVVNVEKVNSSNTIPIGGNKWICIDGDDYPHEIKEGEGGFRQFIRYATEEEKALLNPIDKFTDSDIAIVERLHDTILDNHAYSLESKLLTDARLLANKIKSNIK